MSRIMALNYDVVVNYLDPLITHMGNQPHGGLITHTNSLAGLMEHSPPRPLLRSEGGRPHAHRLRARRTGAQEDPVHQHPPGFVATDRVNADGLPKPFQVSTEHAARCVIRALEREPAQAYFPWATAALVRTLRVLPASLSSAVLRSLASR
ncbi:hypothetical protein [Streptomyces bottropensis]